MYWTLGTLSAGTYSIDYNFVVTERIYDGINFADPGSWFGPKTGCQLLVSA
jgi:hypothetical protein